MITQGSILRMVVRDSSLCGNEEGAITSAGEESGGTAVLQVLASVGRL